MLLRGLVLNTNDPDPTINIHNENKNRVVARSRKRRRRRHDIYYEATSLHGGEELNVEEESSIDRRLAEGGDGRERV